MIEEQNGPPNRPKVQYLALALISGSVLAYELFVMRVFACAGWSHFGSLVISIVMLGFGLFSTILCVRKDFFQRRLLFWVKLSLLLLRPSMAVWSPCTADRFQSHFSPFGPESEIPARLIFFDLSLTLPAGRDVSRPDFSTQKRGVRDGLFLQHGRVSKLGSWRQFFWACIT